MAKAGLPRNIRDRLTPEQKKAVSPWRCPNCGYTNDWNASSCDGCSEEYGARPTEDERRAAKKEDAQ